MDTDLSDRYNDSIVPPPGLTGHVLPPQPLARPVTREQLALARRRLIRSLIAVIVLTLLCMLAGAAWLLNWGW